eukprot:COSAG02_NODE_1492_length_12334_cov_29.721945_3_plen_152_part_00
MGIHSGVCACLAIRAITSCTNLYCCMYGLMTKFHLIVACLYRCVCTNVSGVDDCVPQLSRSSPAYVLSADLLEMVGVLLPPAKCNEHAHAVQARCCEPALTEDETTFAATGIAAEERTGARDMRNYTPTTASGANDLLAWISAQDDSDTDD